MTTMNELQEVITTQADLTESLANVLQQQQEAIVHSRAGELAGLIERSEELLQPIEALEKERVRLAGLIVSGRNERAATQATMVSGRELLKHVDGDDATPLEHAIRRLHAASENVLRINRINRPLLEHSQHFIRHTLRAATDDYTKNLVDKKM